MSDQQLDRIQRKLAKQQRKLERRKQQLAEEAVRDLSPEDRRAVVREWTRRISTSAPAVAIIGVMRWVRDHPAQSVTVAAVSTVIATLIIAPPEDEPGRADEPPAAQLAVPPARSDHGDASADIHTPEPVQDEEAEPEPVDVAPAMAEADGALAAELPTGTPEPAPEPEPSAPPGPEGTAPQPEEETTTPEPEPPPEEPPVEEPPDHDDEVRDRCLLVKTPRVDLGECIRTILGLLEFGDGLQLEDAAELDSGG